MTYPMVEAEMINFLNCCKLKNSEVMLCPRCSFVFNKEATKYNTLSPLSSKTCKINNYFQKSLDVTPSFLKTCIIGFHKNFDFQTLSFSEPVYWVLICSESASLELLI